MMAVARASLASVLAVQLCCASLLALAACQTAPDPVEPAPMVRSGAQVLADRGFDVLHGKRVGLVTNHTAVIESGHLIDALAAEPEVELVALFGPEHGLRGSAQAGDHLDDGIDSVTGIPVYSLYGERRSPADTVLADLDVLVFDIQDIGARFYTYISTMGYSMQAAAASGVPFLVLDRPNPLGRRAEGFIIDSTEFSFVGLYPIPVTHGMTVGELALMIRGERMLDGLESLDLDVIPVSGWSPDSLWPSYGSEWIKTSPNIPDFETALVYPGAGFFEGTSWSEGRGTMTPFRHVGGPGVDADSMAAHLNGRGLPGVRFEPTGFTPVSIPGMSESPKLQDQEVQGVRIVVTDLAKYEPVATGVEMVSAAYRYTPDEDRSAFFNSRWMRRISGGGRLEAMILAGADPKEIVGAWQEEVGGFVKARRRYLLY